MGGDSALLIATDGKISLSVPIKNIHIQRLRVTTTASHIGFDSHKKAAADSLRASQSQINAIDRRLRFGTRIQIRVEQ